MNVILVHTWDPFGIANSQAMSSHRRGLWHRGVGMTFWEPRLSSMGKQNYGRAGYLKCGNGSSNPWEGRAVSFQGNQPFPNDFRQSSTHDLSPRSHSALLARPAVTSWWLGGDPPNQLLAISDHHSQLMITCTLINVDLNESIGVGGYHFDAEANAFGGTPVLINSGIINPGLTFLSDSSCGNLTSGLFVIKMMLATGTGYRSFHH